jgi:hypothetical protein
MWMLLHPMHEPCLQVVCAAGVEKEDGEEETRGDNPKHDGVRHGGRGSSPPRMHLIFVFGFWGDAPERRGGAGVFGPLGLRHGPIPI